MIIKLTKHCLQRREHYEKEDPELIKSVFIECLKDIDLQSLEDIKYKLFHNYFCCIFKKKDDVYTIITIRGHNKLLHKNDLLKVKIKPANAAFKITGGFIIRRINYLGNAVKCGYIIDIVGTEQKLLRLYSNLKDKYNMSDAQRVPRLGLKFTLDSEIKDLVKFNDSEQCYYLNRFDRI